MRSHVRLEPSDDLGENINDDGEEVIVPDIVDILTQLFRRQEVAVAAGAGSPSADDCAKDVLCHAQTVGFNLSKAEGRKAFYNATFGGAAAGTGKRKRHADLRGLLERTPKNRTLEERDGPYQTGNPRYCTNSCATSLHPGRSHRIPHLPRPAFVRLPLVVRQRLPPRQHVPEA